jgi:hypothetical protein
VFCAEEVEEYTYILAVCNCKTSAALMVTGFLLCPLSSILNKLKKNTTVQSSETGSVLVLI